MEEDSSRGTVSYLGYHHVCRIAMPSLKYSPGELLVFYHARVP